MCALSVVLCQHQVLAFQPDLATCLQINHNRFVVINFLFHSYVSFVEYRLCHYLLHHRPVIFHHGFPRSQNDNSNEVCAVACKSPLSLPKDVLDFIRVVFYENLHWFCYIWSVFGWTVIDRHHTTPTQDDTLDTPSLHIYGNCIEVPQWFISLPATQYSKVWHVQSPCGTRRLAYKTRWTRWGVQWIMPYRVYNYPLPL